MSFEPPILRAVLRVLLLQRHRGPDGHALRRLEGQLQDHIKGNLFTGSVESTNVPLVANLPPDPWERYQSEGLLCGRWWGEKLWTMVPTVAIVGQFLQTFKESQPSQVNGSMSVDQALRTLEAGSRP